MESDESIAVVVSEEVVPYSDTDSLVNLTQTVSDANSNRIISISSGQFVYDTTKPVSEEDGAHEQFVYDTTKPVSEEDGAHEHSGLAHRYGINEDLAELAHLLVSWNLGHLLDFFVQQELYIGILKHLTHRMAENLFVNSDVSLGARVEFCYQWTQWIKSFDSSNESSSIGNMHCQRHQLIDVAPQSSNITTTQDQLAKTEISLNEIISSNSYGKSVIESFKKEKIMNDNLRKLLVESVLQYCITNNHDLSVSDCANIATQICEVFPGELASYYYLERKNAAPMGKLYNKFRNWKNNFNRKTTSEGCSKKQKQKVFAAADDEDEHIRALKHDLYSMTYNEKIQHWRSCAATRMNNIQDTQDDPKNIFDAWPQYKLPDGFRLIESDFVFLYGARNEVLDNLNEFCNILLFEVIPNHIKDMKDSAFINMYNEVNKNKATLSEDCISANAFVLLQSLLPRSRISKKVSNNKNDKKRMYSLKESRDSFMAVCATEAEYKQMYDGKVKAESSVAPFISLIGTLAEPQSFMVDFDNISYKFFDFAKALVICFKIYNVFNIAYPEPCAEMWDFINRQFYQLATKNKSKPGIDALLNEIKNGERKEH